MEWPLVSTLRNSLTTPTYSIIAADRARHDGERDRLLAAGMDDYLTASSKSMSYSRFCGLLSPSFRRLEHINKIDPEHPAVAVEIDSSQPQETEANVYKNIIIDWQAARSAANKARFRTRYAANKRKWTLFLRFTKPQKAWGRQWSPCWRTDTYHPQDARQQLIQRVPRLKSVCVTIEKSCAQAHPLRLAGAVLNCRMN